MIQHEDGIPHWFTRLTHRLYVRRCRKQGHQGIPTPRGCCHHCGHVWYTPED